MCNPSVRFRPSRATPGRMIGRVRPDIPIRPIRLQPWFQLERIRSGGLHRSPAVKPRYHGHEPLTDVGLGSHSASASCPRSSGMSYLRKREFGSRNRRSWPWVAPGGRQVRMGLCVRQIGAYRHVRSRCNVPPLETGTQREMALGWTSKFSMDANRVWADHNQDVLCKGRSRTRLGIIHAALLAANSIHRQEYLLHLRAERNQPTCGGETKVWDIDLFYFVHENNRLLLMAHCSILPGMGTPICEVVVGDVHSDQHVAFFNKQLPTIASK
jgi:hypothetical protein